MERGVRYNFIGENATRGDRVLTVPLLIRYLFLFSPAERERALVVVARNVRFTVDDIQKMITDTENGVYYNFFGQPARAFEERMTIQMLRLILNFLIKQETEFLTSSKFTVEDVVRMLTGMENGQRYNFRGDIATAAERAIDARLLLRYLFRLNRADIEKAVYMIIRINNFTIDQVQSMIDQSQMGIRFNYFGKIAAPGEETISLDILRLILEYLKDADLCAMQPCLNGGTCTNIPGANLCRCAPGWVGSHCQISTRNIAFQKTAYMSSLYMNDNKYAAEKGIDGDRTTDLASGACFSTDRESQPSWTVDLGAVYDLQEIRITNRRDCCTERARNIEILAGLTMDDMEPIYYHAGELGPSRTLPVMSGTHGQYVTVRIKSQRPEYLHLCEVEIFGTYLRAGKTFYGNFFYFILL